MNTFCKKKKQANKKNIIYLKFSSQKEFFLLKNRL